MNRFASAGLAVLLIALSTLLGSVPAAAGPLTYRLAPTQDTDVRENANGLNQCGGCTEIVTRNHATGEYRPLYQFDLSGIPPGSRILSATLRIWVVLPDPNLVTIYRVTQPWSEYTLTWANSNGVSHDPTSRGSFTPSLGSRYYEADVTGLANEWYLGTANHGLIMRIAGGGNAYASYSSREWATASQRPELVIVADPPPKFTMLTSRQVITDPVNAATDPKDIPGAVVLYSAQVSNSSSGYPDADSVAVVEPVPMDTVLFVGDISGTGPVSFVQGTPSSDLTYSFSSLSSTTDDLAFSDNGGASFTYSPVPDAGGYDHAVTHIRINPKGTFARSSGSGDPNFTLRFQLRVK